MRSLSTSESSTAAIDRLADEISNRFASRPSLLATLTGDCFQPKNLSHRGCRCQCRQMSELIAGMNYGSIRYQRRSVEAHKPGCPYSS